MDGRRRRGARSGSAAARNATFYCKRSREDCLVVDPMKSPAGRAGNIPPAAKTGRYRTRRSPFGDLGLGIGDWGFGIGDLGFGNSALRLRSRSGRLSAVGCRLSAVSGQASGVRKGRSTKDEVRDVGLPFALRPMSFPPLSSLLSPPSSLFTLHSASVTEVMQNPPFRPGLRNVIKRAQWFSTVTLNGDDGVEGT